MKKIYILALILFTSYIGFAQGVEFEKITLEKAIEKAREENKPIFIDLYTSWCGPCAIMDQKVFPQPVVGAYFNEKYINVKIDGEKGDGPDLVQKYRIQGYPTFLFIDTEGNLIHAVIGYMDAFQLIGEAEKMADLAKYGGWDKMMEDFKNNRRDKEFLKIFYNHADERTKPFALNAYLKSLPDEELLHENSSLMLQEMSIYDFYLMDRLVNYLLNLKENDGQFYYYVGFPIRRSIAKFFDQAIDNGFEDMFQELLVFQEKLHALSYEEIEKDVEIMDGRGLYFSSPTLVRLRYDMKNYHTDDFMDSIVPYMENLLKNFQPGSFKSSIDFWVRNIKALPDWISYYQLRDQHKIMADFILEFTDFYWRNAPSNKKTKKMCADWVEYACNLNPYNPDIVLNAARLFVRLDQKEYALRTLQKAFDLTQDIDPKNEKLLNQINLKIRDVKNNKE